MSMNLPGRRKGGEEVLETKRGKDTERPASLGSPCVARFGALLRCRLSPHSGESGIRLGAGYPLLAVFKAEC